MPPSKRVKQAVVNETVTPPASLSAAQQVARVKQAAGNNTFQLELASGKTALAELPARFRSTIWLKRGTFVILDTEALAERDNKLDGEIVNVVRDEKAFRRMSYWPPEFAARTSTYGEESEDDGPQMPPSDSEDEAS